MSLQEVLSSPDSLSLHHYFFQQCLLRVLLSRLPPHRLRVFVVHAGKRLELGWGGRRESAEYDGRLSVQFVGCTTAAIHSSVNDGVTGDVQCTGCSIKDCKLGLDARRSAGGTIGGTIGWDASNTIDATTPSPPAAATPAPPAVTSPVAATPTPPAAATPTPPIVTTPTPAVATTLAPPVVTTPSPPVATITVVEAGDTEMTETEMTEKENFARFCTLLVEVRPETSSFRGERSGAGEWVLVCTGCVGSTSSLPL